MALTKQKLLHKRSSVVGRILPTSALTYGEIAVNFSSGANNTFLETKKYDNTAGLFFIYPYGTNALTANGVEDGYFSASTSGLTSYFDGLTVKVKLNGHTYNENWNTLNINGIGPKLIWYRYNQPATIQYPVNSEVTLTYRTDAGSYVATANERGLISGQTYTDGWVAQFVPDNGIDAIISGINYTIKQDEFVVSAALNDLNDRKQDLTERVTTINSTSTDDEYPTAKAVYDIVNGSVATNVDYKGATSVVPATSQAGDMYIAANAIALTAAQSATGAAATAETGDFLIARSSGKWDIIQKNLDGAVTTTAVTLTDGNVLVGGGNHTAKVSSYTIGKSVPSTALFTDSATTETGHYTPGTTASTLGSTTAGNFLQTVILDSKKHVISATTATALTSFTETSISTANSGSTNSAAQSVVYGIVTGGTKGHSLTLQRTNKIYSASTADSANVALTATSTSGAIKVYKNGSLLTSFDGSSTVSALTSDTAVTQSNSTTENYRPITLGYTTASTATASTLTATVTTQVYVTNKASIQPSTGKIVAGGFQLHTSSTNLLTADGNSIAQSTFLTADTSPSISVTNSGSGVVTGGTTGGTKGHSITLNKTTAVKVNSATTADSSTSSVSATTSKSATTSTSATTAASSVSATTSKSATTSTSASTASSSVSATTSKSATTASSSVSATTSKSATTSVSASTAASAAKTANSLKIYKNGTLQVTFDGSSSLSALTTDTATTYNGHFTPTGSSTTSGARVTGITIDGKGHVTSIATAATDNVDTKVTDANGNGKAFLLGHATQSSNATAVSNANVYMSAGTVSMTELKLAEKAKMVYNTTNNCIDFVFI